MLRNFGIIEEDPIPSLEAYFMQCSVAITCRDLAIMAATLANGGVNPITGARAVVRGYVENILSVMASCGMYDAAGEWIYNVGMPAKSGVAGGIFAVLPGQLGIGVYSPRLDGHGNSVRGIEACRAISQQFGLHMFNVPRLGSSVIRRSGDLAHSHSRHLRSPIERQALAAVGHSSLILELQGDLGFGSAEVAIRPLSSASQVAREVILNLAHVTSLDSSAAGVFAMAFSSWLASGRRISVCDSARFPILPKILRLELPDRWQEVDLFDDYSLALEQAEDRLLAQAGLAPAHSSPIALQRCTLVAGLAPGEMDKLAALVTHRSYPTGHVILRAGDQPGGLFFLLRGRASAWITSAAGRSRRIATFSPGMSFGESALLDRSPRSAEIRADDAVECAELPLEAIDAILTAGGTLPITLLRNLSLLLNTRVRDANAELSNYLP